MKTRNGKIARLPKKIREELNHRLEDGCPGVKIVEWLNAHPRVQKVLRKEFNGEPISEQNLSRWKEGGYQEWLRQREALEQMRWTIERSGELGNEEDDKDFCEHVARIVTVEIAQQVQRMGEIKNPKERWKSLREISLELWRLRNATSYGQSVGLGWHRWRRQVRQEEASQHQNGEQAESQEEFLERLMDFLHRPDLREWVRTDFPSREAEMTRLRQIYGLKPGSTNTPFHPAQTSREACRRAARYNYPADSQNGNNSQTHA